MTTQELPLQMHMLRSFKGAAVSVVMALWFSGMPQNAKWLQRQTGYRDEAVQEALEVLNEYQMVTRIDRYHWQIAGNARQFPLSQAMLETINEDEAGLNHTETILPLFQKDSGKTGVPVCGDAEICGTPEKPESESGKTGVPVSSSSRSINLDSKNKDLLLARNELIEIFEQFSVREPKRSQLINAGIEPRAALFHLTTAPNVPMAIYRMQAGWPVKKGWEPVRESVVETYEDEPVSYPEIPDNQVAAFGRALECLRANISNGVFVTWFASLRLAGPVKGGIVTIRTGNSYAVDQVTPYAGELQRVLGSEFGTDVSIKFIVI